MDNIIIVYASKVIFSVIGLLDLFFTIKVLMGNWVEVWI